MTSSAAVVGPSISVPHAGGRGYPSLALTDELSHPPDQAPAGVVTVEWVLSLRELERGDPVVRAGRESLRREVRWAHVADLPNISRLLAGGELLFTSSLSLTNRGRDQRTSIRRLVNCAAAGLVVELAPGVSRLPPALVEEAERFELPLIELRREVPFVQVTEAIHRAIVNREHAQLERGTEVHDELNEIVLAGGDTDDVLRALAGAVGNPVVLENEREELLGYADLNDSSSRALSSWRGLRNGTVAGKTATEIPIQLRGGDGRLVALGLDRPVTDCDRIVLQRSAWLIAIMLQRCHQEAEMVLRARGNFLLDLTEGRVGPETAEAMANAVGFGDHPVLVPAAIQARGVQSAVLGDRWMEIARGLGTELNGRAIAQVVGVRPADNQILVVAGLSSAAERVRLAEQIADISHTVVDRSLPGAQVATAVGAATDWQGMAETLREAIDAARAAGSTDASPWLDAAEPDIDRLFWLLRDHEAVRSFVNRYLGPLLAYDRSHKRQLMPTLESFCEHGGNKTETAQDLYVARQALYKRLTRISDILGADISKPEVLAAASMAIKASRHIEA